MLAPVQLRFITAVYRLKRPLLAPEDSEILEMGLTYVSRHSHGLTQNREYEKEKKEKGEKGKGRKK